MQDNVNTPESNVERTAGAPKNSGRRKKLIALLAGAALIAGGAVGAHAITQSKTFQHVQTAAFDGGGWRRDDRRPLHELSDAELQERVTRAVRHISIEIDGTAEQEQQIIAIALGAATEMRGVAQQMRDSGMVAKELLTAEPIDRTALEALRTARVADMDRISKTLVAAVADVAEVLTPEQRAQVQEMIRAHRDRERGHWRRGG